MEAFSPTELSQFVVVVVVILAFKLLPLTFVGGAFVLISFTERRSLFTRNISFALPVDLCSPLAHLDVRKRVTGNKLQIKKLTSQTIAQNIKAEIVALRKFSLRLSKPIMAEFYSIWNSTEVLWGLKMIGSHCSVNDKDKLHSDFVWLHHTPIKIMMKVVCSLKTQTPCREIGISTSFHQAY